MAPSNPPASTVPQPGQAPAAIPSEPPPAYTPLKDGETVGGYPPPGPAYPPQGTYPPQQGTSFHCKLL